MSDNCKYVYWKCAIPNLPSDVFTDSASCEQYGRDNGNDGALNWQLIPSSRTTGNQKEFGSTTKTLTYYTDCNCDTAENWSNSDKWRENCDKYSGPYYDPNLYCLHASDGKTRKSCFINTSAGLVKLNEETSCRAKDHVMKYKSCRCRRLFDDDMKDVSYPKDGQTYGCLTVAKSCIGKSVCTVDPSRGADDQHCIENGKYVVSLNGGVTESENCWQEF